MSAPEYGSAEWAMRYARDYRNETQAKDALAALADEVLSLRAENRLFRELVGQIRRERAGLLDPSDGEDES